MNLRAIVVVRLRPPLADEESLPVSTHKCVDGQTVVLGTSRGDVQEMVARFDDVFDGNDDQRYFYEHAVSGLVFASFEGVGAVILAYGALESGKTHTILGPMRGRAICDESGIFLRVLDDLFAYRERVKKRRHVLIYLSGLELTSVAVVDLFERNGVNLCGLSAENFPQHVSLSEVTTMEDVVDTFMSVKAVRNGISTDLMECSTRAHAFLFVDIVQVSKKHFPDPPSLEELIQAKGFTANPDVKGILHSRIALADLAGSKSARQMVAGNKMADDQVIAKSFQTLGTCIRSIHMGDSHVPFSDCPLTTLLRLSIAERDCNILLAGHVSSLLRDYEETKEVLSFCDKIKEMNKDTTPCTFPSCDIESEAQKHTLHEELITDVRIAGIVALYAPQRPNNRAVMNRANVEEIRRIIIDDLTEKKIGLKDRREAEFLEKAKSAISKENDKKVRLFAAKMNDLIDEYDELSRSVKQEKKNIKTLVREYEASNEEAITEAKKAKKKRLKLQERLEQFRETLGIAGDAEGPVGAPQANDDKSDIDSKWFGDKKEEMTEEEKEREDLLDVVVRDFCTTGRDVNTVLMSFAQRLHATQRQRAQVRRLKIHCSSIILESTLVEDIIEFIVDRAVDISHRVIKPSHKYSWEDIEGLSTVMKNGDRLYPPLLVQVSKKQEVEHTEKFHRVTFLSSDESDAENSHYPRETRRPPGMGDEFYDYNLKAGKANAWDDGDVESQTHRKGQSAQVKAASGTSTAKQGTRGGEEFYSDEEVETEEDEEEMDQPSLGSKRYADDDDGSCSDGASGDNVGNGGEVGRLTDAERQKLRARRDHQYLMRIYDSPTLIDDLIKFLCGGCVMLKHGRIGKPHRRLFWVSLQHGVRKLLWVDPDSNATHATSFINLDDVSYIQVGCFSKVFKRHLVTATDPSFYRSFTIGMKNGSRTVDVVADTLADFEAWVIGLSNLVRVDPTWGGKLDVTVEVNYDRLNCFEASLCETNYIFPTQYIMLKRRVMQIAAYTLEVLKECGNDANKAQEILNGIHPPGINEKGAVYLTKGELRFIGHNEMDIIRITKVWMLFQQMNLVYDDNFVPATTFGVSKRT
uniref:Putative kinesin n=1 Tax=Trypanosoma congolense (strain IL3000) TaxID=1068625 RepID=G0UNN7_TRYCI|nr:putative kinesin [Trypanosoma congolense IL3000]